MDAATLADNKIIDRQERRIAELEATIQEVWKAYTVVVSAGNGSGSWDRHVKPAIYAAKKIADQ